MDICTLSGLLSKPGQSVDKLDNQWTQYSKVWISAVCLEYIQLWIGMGNEGEIWAVAKTPLKHILPQLYPDMSQERS